MCFRHKWTFVRQETRAVDKGEMPLAGRVSINETFNVFRCPKCRTTVEQFAHRPDRAYVREGTQPQGGIAAVRNARFEV